MLLLFGFLATLNKVDKLIVNLIALFQGGDLAFSIIGERRFNARYTTQIVGNVSIGDLKRVIKTNRL